MDELNISCLFSQNFEYMVILGKLPVVEPWTEHCISAFASSSLQVKAEKLQRGTESIRLSGDSSHVSWGGNTEGGRELREMHLYLLCSNCRFKAVDKELRTFVRYHEMLNFPPQTKTKQNFQALKVKLEEKTKLLSMNDGSVLCFFRW